MKLNNFIVSVFCIRLMLIFFLYRMMKIISRLEIGDVGENLLCLSLFILFDCDNLFEFG